MPIEVEAIPVFSFNELEKAIGTDTPLGKTASRLAGAAGVYVWGFRLTEDGPFHPYYVGKHTSSILARLAEHFHIGLPYGTHVVFTKEHIEANTELRGFPDPCKPPRSDFEEVVAFPFVRRQGDRVRTTYACETCGGPCTKACRSVRQAVEFYQSHFVACAFIAREMPPVAASGNGALVRRFDPTTVDVLRRAYTGKKRVTDVELVTASLERLAKTSFGSSQIMGRVSEAAQRDREAFIVADLMGISAGSSGLLPLPANTLRYRKATTETTVP